MSVCCRGTLANHGVWVGASQPVDEQPQDLSESGKGPSPAKLPERARGLSSCLFAPEAWTVYIPEDTMPKVTAAALRTKKRGMESDYQVCRHTPFLIPCANNA